MANVKVPKAEIRTVQGGWVEFATFPLDLAEVGAGAVVATDVELTGVGVSDLVFVNIETAVAGIVITGAKVKAANTITVYAYNPTAAAVDQASKTFSIMIVHL